MARKLNTMSERRIKKAEMKVKSLKASTAQMRHEIAQLLNLAENRYQEIVQTREAVRPLILAAAELPDAQLDELITTWLDRNDGG